MSGHLDSSRIPPRSSLARATGREEKASKFCVMREKRGVRASCCVTRLSVHLEDTGAHSRLGGLKAERVRWQSVLAVEGKVALIHFRPMTYASRPPSPVAESLGGRDKKYINNNSSSGCPTKLFSLSSVRL